MNLRTPHTAFRMITRTNCRRMHSCPYATFRSHQLPSPQLPLGARSVGSHRVPRNWRDNVFTVNHVFCLWSIHGQRQAVIDGREQRCPAHHLAIYFPGMEQNIFSKGRPWEYCWWTMDGPQAVPLTAGFDLHPSVYRAGPAPTELINELTAVIPRPDRSSEIAASAIAYALLAAAAKATQLGGGLAAGNMLVKSAREHLNAHWQDPTLGVKQLAAHLDVNRVTLSRRFRAATGITLIEYITTTRIQNAITLLQEPKLSVAEVGRHCGYYDPSYFCRVFRKRMGVNPSAFRGR
ncbi:MAG: AraC-like DNA-binding protein [Rhodothermales bacterium]|jgi:AraC-like DNA-binding protein